MFLKTIFLNFTTKLSNRSLVLLLGLRLLLHMPAFIWIKLRQIFLKRRSFKHLYDWDILIISFIFGGMEMQNWKSFRRALIIFCQTFNLHMSCQKNTFLDLNVSLENRSITTDLHTKSTDCHQYLHCHSSYPDHIKIQ